MSIADTATDNAALEDGRGRDRSWLVPAGLALAITGLLGGLFLGRGMAAQGPERVTDAASVGFVRDMSTHHAQAVRMSEIVHRRSLDPVLNYLAFDILSTQQGQIGIMNGWMELWQQPSGGSGPAMAWMGHDGPMPGMATDEQIAELNTLPVPQMEEQFLRLMIRHHRGAVPMADAAVARAVSPEVRRIAEQMSAGQQSEIDLMQDLLATRNLGPEPITDNGHSPNSTAPATSGSHGDH